MIHNHPTPYQKSKINQNEMGTIFSRADVDRLFDIVDLGYNDDGSKQSVYAFKSVTATYGKDFRITLSRYDDGDEDGFLSWYSTSSGESNCYDYIKGFGMKGEYTDVIKQYNNIESGFFEYNNRFASDVYSHMDDWAQRHAKEYDDIESFVKDYDKQKKKYVKHLHTDEDNEFNEAVEKANSYFRRKNIPYEFCVEWF